MYKGKHVYHFRRMVRDYEYEFEIAIRKKEDDRTLYERMDRVLERWEFHFKFMRKPPEKIQRKVLRHAKKYFPKGIPVKKETIILAFGFS